MAAPSGSLEQTEQPRLHFIESRLTPPTFPSKQIAENLRYSEMGISKARSELEANQLCDVTRKGKEMRLRFPYSSQELWDKAEPLLRTPLLKQHWIQWGKPAQDVKRAGVSALSQFSNLADDATPRFALKKQGFLRLLEQGELYGCPDRHEADACIEAWSYDPTLLSDEKTVDPLSLYLSLRDNPDERIQSALTDMMEVLAWR